MLIILLLIIMTACSNAETSISDAGSYDNSSSDYSNYGSSDSGSEDESGEDFEEEYYEDEDASLDDYLYGTLGAIPWEDAAGYYEGEYVTLFGVVEGSEYASASNGRPTFLNIGNEYPNSDRVTVVIWGENRDNFDIAPESYYLGELVVVRGELYYYEGVPEIEVYSPDDIFIVDESNYN